MTNSRLAGGRYDRFAWHYEATTRDRFRPGEAAFYADLARTCAGPVLEPACGAARILAVVYAAGAEVHGSDASEPMLKLAARRLAAVRAADPALADTPYRLFRQRLQELDLPGHYGLILLPLDGFRLLRDRAEQTRFLSAARRLVPDGLLALDLTLPTAPFPAPMASSPLVGEGGSRVQASVRWRTRGEDVIEETAFVIRRRDGSVTRQVCRDAYRIVTPEALDEVLATAGWRVVERHADFLGTPFEPDAGRLVLLAEPGGSPPTAGNTPRR